MTPYVTVEEADEYFATRLNSEDWEDATDTEKLNSLYEATRAINLLRFKGVKYISTQENAWPRLIDTTHSSVVSSDGPDIPDWLVDATCEIAINLLDGTDMEQEAENLLANNQSYATVSTSYNPDLVQEHLRAGIPSIKAWNLLRPYLANVRSIRLSRG